ncbi:MAG: VOC family protein [Pseudomonadota bacterium]
MMQAAPQLMFEVPLKGVIEHWRGAFPDMEVAEDGPVTAVRIGGLALRLYHSPAPHDFTFTPSMSIALSVEDVAAVDRIAAHLGTAGEVLMPLDRYDFAERFTWVVDRFGVSWQILKAPA